MHSMPHIFLAKKVDAYHLFSFLPKSQEKTKEEKEQHQKEQKQKRDEFRALFLSKKVRDHLQDQGTLEAFASFLAAEGNDHLITFFTEVPLFCIG